MQTQPNVGDTPAIINIHNVACSNPNYRKEIWTGGHLQVTVMSIPVGGEIGLELHDDLDQLLYVQYGMAAVYMGPTKQGVEFVSNAGKDNIILVPQGTWHNVINCSNVPLKLFSVYAPPHHPVGTVQPTKFDSDLADY